MCITIIVIIIINYIITRDEVSHLKLILSDDVRSRPPCNDVMFIRTPYTLTDDVGCELQKVYTCIVCIACITGVFSCL